MSAAVSGDTWGPRITSADTAQWCHYQLRRRKRVHPDNLRFRLPELLVASYRVAVTTYTEINVAGVAWPTYKVVALIIGALVLIAVGLVTASLGPAVLTAAGIATLVWVAGGRSLRR